MDETSTLPTRSSSASPFPLNPLLVNPSTSSTSTLPSSSPSLFPPPNVPTSRSQPLTEIDDGDKDMYWDSEEDEELFMNDAMEVKKLLVEGGGEGGIGEGSAEEVEEIVMGEEEEVEEIVTGEEEVEMDAEKIKKRRGGRRKF